MSGALVVVSEDPEASAPPPGGPRLSGVVHRRGSFVLRCDSWVTSPGLTTVVGLNGAGKTTLLSILGGILAPGSGKRHDVGRYPLLPQGALVDRGFRVRGLLTYVAGLRGVPRRERCADVERVLQMCGLEAVADAKLNRMSRGWQQRVMIAQCLLGRPRGVLLDEPTLSLDVQASRDCWTLLRSLASTMAVIVATHEASAAIEFSDQLTTVRAGLVGEPLPAVELRASLRLHEGSPESFLLGLVGSEPPTGSA